MNKIFDKHLLTIIITTATILASLCFSYGALVQRVENIDDRLAQIESRLDKVFGGLSIK
jgi:hypothetical protein